MQPWQSRASECWHNADHSHCMLCKRFPSFIPDTLCFLWHQYLNPSVLRSKSFCYISRKQGTADCRPGRLNLAFVHCTASEQDLSLPSYICFLVCEMGILILISLQWEHQGTVEGNALKCNIQLCVLS